MYSKPFPQSIAEKIAGKPCVSDTVGESDSTVLIFEDAVLKIEPTNCNANREYAALRWLQNRLPVPEILDFAQADGQNFLLISKLRGAMASDQIADSVEDTVKALADGLQLLWRVDISDCPLDSTLDKRLRDAKYNIENGLVDTDDFEPETLGENGFADVHALYDYLERSRPSADLVFTHGDYCLPNVFIDKDKTVGFGQGGHRRPLAGYCTVCALLGAQSVYPVWLAEIRFSACKRPALFRARHHRRHRKIAVLYFIG